VRKASAIVVPLLLVGLTVIIGVWDLRTVRTGEARSVAVKTTPTPPPTISVIRPRGSAQDFEAGVSIVIYGNDPYFTDKTQALLNRLATLGVNSVSLVIPVFQQGWAASEVYADPTKTPTDAAIAVFASQARRRGFTVMLRPLLDIVVDQDGSHWRGTIQPQDDKQWKTTYAALVAKYARVAEDNHIGILDIGSELDSMEKDGAFWQKLITTVRADYHGQVTYSSNWAKSFPSFGKSLDFISVDAYFPLKAPTTASVSDLVAAWQQWVARLKRMSQSFGKRLVLTELGATSLTGSFQQPWLWDNFQPVDLSAQQVYYDAACQAVVPRFGGVYWWMYTLDPPAKPAVDRGFMVAGKPAEASLAHCFGGSVPLPAPGPSPSP
jgi:hypothetical protein